MSYSLNVAFLLLALEKVDLLVHIQKIQLELDRNKNNAQDYASLCEEMQTKEKEKESSIKHLKIELEGKELECKKWVTKIKQANELARDIDEKEREIIDLNANLEREKEKRLHGERMYQNLTERENELQKQLSTLIETSKIEHENELSNALEVKEKEILDLNANLEYEKEKRKHIERMFQDLTERENEVQLKLKVSEDKTKVCKYSEIMNIE